MSGKRFYDRDPIVSEAVRITSLFPKDLQGVIAHGLSMVAIRDFQADTRMRQLKSLGTDKILPLYKSKNKRRSYDGIPEFHNAMNYLLILSEDEQTQVSHKVIKLAGFAQAYLTQCKTYDRSPVNSDIETLRNKYIELGPEQAEDYLQTMQEEFLASLKAPESYTNIISDGSTIQRVYE